MTTPEEYWAKVRAAPGFKEAAAGKNIKLPPVDPPKVHEIKGVTNPDMRRRFSEIACDELRAVPTASETN